MTDDIVARLREEHYKFVAVPKENKLEMSSKSVKRLGFLWLEAADEIERLRRRLLAEENAYDIERRQNEHLHTDRNNLELEVERLRARVAELEAERAPAP